MKRLFVLGTVLFALVGSGCATRGYARRQAREVQGLVTQVQTQHQTDVARIDGRLTMNDQQVQRAVETAAQANANATQANANAAQANASAAQAASSASQANSNAAQANASAASANASAAQANTSAALQARQR
jgi:hypothetical protein